MTLAEILDEIPKLTVAERKLVVNRILDSLLETPKQRSLSELRGLGAEIWAGVDAQEYVDQMRDEWDDRS